MKTIRRALILLGAAFAFAPLASGAEVDKVIAGKDLVILRLTAKERAALAPGQVVTLEVDGKRTQVEAEVEGLDGGKARLKVHYGIGQLSEGARVSFADGGRAAAAAEPAGPIGVRSFTYPLALTGRIAARFDAPATELVRIDRYAVTGYLRKVAAQANVTSDAGRARSRAEGTSFGAAPAFMIARGVRFGLGYDAEDLTERVRIENTAAGTVASGKRGWQMGTVTAHAAVPVGPQVVAGLKYGSTKLRIYDDVGAGDNGVEQLSDMRPSVAYLAKTYEVHAEFQPKIDVGRGSATLKRGPTWSLFYRREIGTGRLLLVDAAYELRSAVSETESNALTVRGGTVASIGGLPVLGALVGFKPGHHEDDASASLATARRFLVSAFIDYRSDAATHYALVLDAAVVDEGRVSGQELSYQAVFARAL